MDKRSGKPVLGANMGDRTIVNAGYRQKKGRLSCLQKQETALVILMASALVRAMVQNIPRGRPISWDWGCTP